MIKIHSADKIIYLTNSSTLLKSDESSIIVNVSSEKELTEFYDVLIKSGKIKDIYFFNESEGLLFDWFKCMFKIIEAAGGLVKNADNEYLFILRHGKWDLPKGKIEKGESIKNAAIREVEEECGISGLTITEGIKPTYHTYHINDKAILKPTYWFKMDCSDTSKLIPQQEEGITEVRWLKLKELEMVRNNTYESIKDVIAEL
jgi:8-oxo-dGTP pyrophosphatase MutT (NUDIX family)